MPYQVYFVDFSLRQKGKQTDLHIVCMVLVLKTSCTCIMLIILIIFLSSLLLCHVDIIAKSSGFSFDEVFKLKF